MSRVENEARRALRLRTFKGGSIVFGLEAPIQCIIRNMSQAGAGLELEAPSMVPDDFNLIIKPECVTRKCRAVWRSDDRIGAQFV